jgi:hypothetical protein
MDVAEIQGNSEGCCLRDVTEIEGNNNSQVVEIIQIYANVFFF